MEFVPELLLRSEEEYRFYMELKRRTGKALDRDSTENEQGFEIGHTKVLFADGKIVIIREGKTVTECTINEFSRHPNRSFRKLAEAIQRSDD